MSEEYYEEHIQDFISTIFFEGDYLEERTASGEEEVGIRLQHKLDRTITKEQAETLYDLVLRGFDYYELQGIDTEKVLKKRKRLIMSKDQNTAQEEYNDLEQEFGGMRFHQYCILFKGEEGTGIFGEFETPKEAAEYYKHFLSHAIDEKDVTIELLTMVCRLNDDGDAYQVDEGFMTHKNEGEAS